MLYQEYKISAERHLYTCNQLLCNLRDIGDQKSKNKVLTNTYYLSGYIIENIISYKFFDFIGYPENKSVYLFKRNSETFDSLFRKHSYLENERRLIFMIELGLNLSNCFPFYCSNINEDVLLMYEEWDATVRYTTTHLSFPINEVHTREFIQTARDIYSYLRKL
jgi:hypothetical protein